MQDLELDNDPLPFTQGRVTKLDTVSNCFEIAVHSGYPSDYARFGDNCYVHIHDPNSKKLKQEGEMLYTSRSEPASGGLRFFLRENTLDYYNLRVGDLVTVGQPGFVCAVSLYNTFGTQITNVKIYSAPGCGVIENGGGGTVIDRLEIRRGPKPASAREHRLFSSTFPQNPWITFRFKNLYKAKVNKIF